MKYDIVAGMDNSTLNNLVSQVYTKIYPSIFNNTIMVGQMGIASVGFDINASPTVNLNVSQSTKDFVAAKFDELEANLTSKHMAEFIDMATAAVLELDASSIVLTINYINGSPPTKVKASLAAIVSISSEIKDGKSLLVAQIRSATIKIPTDPTMEALLNNAFVPEYLVPYLNENILDPIEIPAIQYGSLVVSLPVPVVQSPYVLAYSALGTAQPDIPAPAQWPTGCEFFGADTAVLQTAAAIPFPLGPSTGFDWKIISGTVRAQVLAPNNFVINSDGSITASIQANALAQLKVHTPWPLPDFTFGPSASGAITASLKPYVSNGQVSIVIQSCSIPTFHFSWGSIPSWVEYILSPLLDGLGMALNAVFGPLISQILSQFSIPVYTIPTFSVTLAGKQINISVNQASTSSQNSLLMINAQAGISA